jgi:RNA polymerase sigma factor (sigma-70 family)
MTQPTTALRRQPGPKPIPELLRCARRERSEDKILAQASLFDNISNGMRKEDVGSGKMQDLAGFPATHWSLVLRAVGSGSREGEAALAKLCEAYWPPLYAFVRHKGYSSPEAEDLTQEFFARLIRKEVLLDLDREGGKFRSFLLTALKRFLANEWHRENAQKRGGGQCLIQINEAAEALFLGMAVDHETPESLFEQHWALTVLDMVLARLRREYAAAGKEQTFSQLQGCLPGAQEELSYAAAGAALKLSESGVRMAALRLRRRYGELLRAEVAVTVSSPAEIEEELRHLIKVAGNL